jgi:preprotein translocase subunit YajC
MSLNSLDILLADAAAPATQPNPTGQIMTMVVYVVIIIVMFYFVSIRPQSKKAKEHANLLKAMKPGDKVVTNGGIVAIVVSVKEKTVAVRSAETKLEVLKSAIADITERAGESTASES